MGSREKMSIIIGADIVPVKTNQEAFENGPAEELTGRELLEELRKAEYRIFNLETPLYDRDAPIVKMGPCLRASGKSVNGLKNIGADLLTLANNHIMDHGIQGLRNTVAVLEKAGISTVGAGENLQQARKAYFAEIRGKRIGIYGCAEHEFSIAGEDSPGANPFDALESPDDVARMKEQCDYAIVLYHGGKEHYRYPSPDLQKTCRKLVDKGADLVVCQHSHCIGCKEEYRNGTIVYGQGNFLFDGEDNEYWNTGLLISISEDGAVGYIPLMKTGSGVRLADSNEAEKILSEFRKRSDDIRREGFIRQQYMKFASESIDDYYLYLTGKRDNLAFRIANKLSGHRLEKRLAQRYGRKVRTGLRNYVECEAHRELLIKGLEQHK